jgi:hypothetical protein
MPTSSALTLDQANATTLSGTVTSGGSAYNLTGVTLNMYLKASAATSDSAATVLSTATGEIAVVSAAGGTFTVTVPAASVATAGQSWYRVDAVASGNTRTVVYGPLTVQDL